MAVSLVALFMSLGGVGYAAISIPHNSVGVAQLRNNAVSYKKIQPGAVGTVRANLNQLQERVGQVCASGSAIGTIQNNGKVTCNATLPAEFGTTDNSVTLTTAGTSTPVTSRTLPSGSSYVAIANPTAAFNAGGSQRITLTCTLTVGSNTETRSATANTGTANGTVYASIPMQVAGQSGASSVACAATTDSGPLPTTSVTASISALQTASNS